jgi:5-formyltetrahydrofolate cyclo-ligase
MTTKNQIRRRIWKLMEKKGVVLFPGAQGRIPNFKGADLAAKLLPELPEWQKSHVIKSNPDSPQRPVRYLALNSGKIVYMAVPRLREKKCFLKLDPSRIRAANFFQASTIKGSFHHGIQVDPKEISQVDLIVAGSVAVNRKGSRIGKGGGYSDLEYAIGREFGFIKEDVVILSTVHSSQIVDEDLPETGHDFRIDFIVTPNEIIPTWREGGRPKGIIWKHLTEERISSIPVLKDIIIFPNH